MLPFVHLPTSQASAARYRNRKGHREYFEVSLQSCYEIEYFVYAANLEFFLRTKKFYLSFLFKKLQNVEV